VQGYNSKNRKEIFYPNLPSAIRPFPHGPGIPVPVPPEILEDTPVDSDKEDTESDQDFQCDPCSTETQLFSQSELHDLVRDLGLPKDSAEVLEFTVSWHLFVMVQEPRKRVYSIFLSRWGLSVLK
jgi:hypothetical protein